MTNEISQRAKEIALTAIFDSIEEIESPTVWEDDGPWLLAPGDFAKRITAALSAEWSLGRDAGLKEAADKIRDLQIPNVLGAYLRDATPDECADAILSLIPTK